MLEGGAGVFVLYGEIRQYYGFHIGTGAVIDHKSRRPNREHTTPPRQRGDNHDSHLGRRTTKLVRR